MSAASTIFGALSGLANFGEQSAEATQEAHEEIYKRLVEGQRTQQFQTQQQEAQQRLQAGRQLQPIGTPVTAPGGKVYQRFQNPLDGSLSVQELPGPAVETQEQALYRSLTTDPINMTADDARKLLASMYQRNPPVAKVDVYDQATNQWFKKSYNPLTEEVYGITPEAQPSAYAPRYSSGYYTDPVTMLQLPRAGVSGKVLPGQPVPGFPSAAPGMPQFQAPYVPFMPSPGLTSAVPGGQEPAAPVRPLPPGTTVGPGFIGTDAAGQPIPPPTPGTTQLGPYHDLVVDPGGTPVIPVGASTPPIVEAANTILQGGDVNSINPRLRGYAEAKAREYGWKGQGSLTPKMQMQIQQVDDAITQAIKTYDQWKYIFDNWATKAYYATIPLDPAAGGEGGIGAAVISVQHSTTSRAGADFIGVLNRMRGVVTGVRQMTGSSTAEGAANRMLAELPTFIGAKDSKDALFKLQQFQRELGFMKKLGYPATDSDASRMGIQVPEVKQPAAPGTVSDDDFLMNVSKPPAGP